MITYMTEDMSTPKDNPFKQEDLSVVEQIKGVKSAKVKESEDSTYVAKITNSHSSGDVDLKKRVMCQMLITVMVSQKMIMIHKKKSWS